MGGSSSLIKSFFESIELSLLRLCLLTLSCVLALQTIYYHDKQYIIMPHSIDIDIIIKWINIIDMFRCIKVDKNLYLNFEEVHKSCNNQASNMEIEEIWKKIEVQFYGITFE